MPSRRVLALASLAAAATAVILALIAFVTRFPSGLSVLVCLVLAGLAAWYGVRRRGAVRVLGGLAALALLAGAAVLVVVEGALVLNLLAVATVLGALASARRAFRIHISLPPAAAPERPVMFYNPLSGGGKAERFHLADEARRRGIHPIELRHGDDLEQLVRAAVRDGARALSMAGGDGSQAIVAKVAAEFGLPYACIPAGTRNHFALDLGVDRDDVVGALDAFAGGGERRVDLAEVNGRVFVNNVSLGLYAQAVQRAGYRDAKLRTLVETVPDAIGPHADPPRMWWSGPAGRESGAAVLVSNNRYRLGRALGSGTRPRVDAGMLGIAVIGPETEREGHKRGPALALEQRSVESFEIECDGVVPAGIDGEATMLDPPLRFRSRPGALRVRIAPQHPGASPSAVMPDSPWQAVRDLARLAFAPGATPGADGDTSASSLPSVARK